MKFRGKNYKNEASKITKGKVYSKEEAVKLIKEISNTKFDATVEVAMNLNLDVKKADQQIRGAMVLPKGTGKETKVLVVTKGSEASAAKEAGADYVGDTDMLEKIEKENWFDFDTLIATPDMMPQLGKLGKILGPKGLMPNPKSGTVTMDVTKAINDIKSGKVEYRLDKTNIIHLGFGKVSFGTEKLLDNYNTVIDAIIKAKPAAAKGQYIRSVAVSTTMGPSVYINQK